MPPYCLYINLKVNACNDSFRIHAFVQNSGVFVKSTTRYGPGNCYSIPDFPCSYFHGQVIGL